MITSVHYQPHFYSTAYNPIVWSFSSDKASELNFSYVVDVYVNAATGATAGYYRIKQKPNQLGACMVDVSSIVQGYVDLTLYSAEEGWPLPFRNGSDIVASVFIKVGEEYGYPQSNLVIYNGYGATGAPAYPLYSGDYPGFPVLALPGALENQDAVDSMAATGGYGYYSDYIMGGVTGGPGIGAGGTGNGKFLTTAPLNGSGKRALPAALFPWANFPITRVQDIGTEEHQTLTFLNWSPKFISGNWGKYVNLFRIYSFDKNGNLLGDTSIGNDIPNGGGPATYYTTGSGATNVSFDRIYSLLTVPVGTADVGFGCFSGQVALAATGPTGTFTYTNCAGQKVTEPINPGQLIRGICMLKPPFPGSSQQAATGPAPSPIFSVGLNINNCNAATGNYPTGITPRPGVTGNGWATTGVLGSYVVFAEYLANSSGTIRALASEALEFVVGDNCQDLYPAVRLSWLNELGGRDYYTFDMFYEKVSTSTGLEYQQVPLNWNAYTPVVTTGNPNANTAPNWQRGGGKSFNKVTGRRFSIQSDWLTQQYVDYLAGIAQSPSVWAYVGDEPIPYTVVVTNTEYTYKTVKQTKMVQVTFDCQLTKVQPRQNY